MFIILKRPFSSKTNGSIKKGYFSFSVLPFLHGAFLLPSICTKFFVVSAVKAYLKQLENTEL